ncbi:MAG: outer membrane protein, partial [Beijerinckiaceae bacterium]
LATPTLQIYGTGGLAYGGITSRTTLSTQRIGGTSITRANAIHDGTLFGWAAGGGVEWAFMPKWTVKAEYLRYDLGEASAYGLAASSSGLFSYTTSTNTRFNGNLIQAGVTRHFDLFAEGGSIKKD